MMQLDVHKRKETIVNDYLLNGGAAGEHNFQTTPTTQAKLKHVMKGYNIDQVQDFFSFLIAEHFEQIVTAEVHSNNMKEAYMRLRRGDGKDMDEELGKLNLGAIGQDMFKFFKMMENNDND